MKTLTVNRKIAVSVVTVMLLIYGVQDISYGQDRAPAIAPGENNSSLLVRFEVSLDRDDANAYQIQLRRKTPQGEWISKCIAIERASTIQTNDLGVIARPQSTWHVFSFHWSSTNFNVRAIFADLESGTTYETRYRDTNLSVCGETPPTPDPWSGIGEETTHLVPPPRVEFVNANLARAVRKELNLDTEGGHIDLLKIPEAKLVRLTELDASESEIIDLTPLAQLTQLTDLDLSDNQISDLTPLAQLTQLTDLDLSDNQISDLTPLAQLTQLTDLDLSDNQISDVNPLAGLTGLTWLYLSGNQISDVNPLTSLLSLRSLSLRRNPITDTSPLNKLVSENPKLVLPIYLSLLNRGGTDFLLGGPACGLWDIRPNKGNFALDVAGGKMYWLTGQVRSP